MITKVSIRADASELLEAQTLTVRHNAESELFQFALMRVNSSRFYVRALKRVQDGFQFALMRVNSSRQRVRDMLNDARASFNLR